MSYREYDVLPFNWTAILGLRFGGEPVLPKFMDFAKAYNLLGIAYPLTVTTKEYFGPTQEPQICMQWLKGIACSADL